MTHGFGGNKKDKKKHGLMQDKDYISEAYLQGGKAVGKIIKPKKKKKIN
jgi:hypothetical protein